MTDIPGVLALSIPIVAIVVFGIKGILRLLVQHRERMAMIEMGLHPDYPPPDDAGAEPASPGPASRAQVQPLRPVVEGSAKSVGEK